MAQFTRKIAPSLRFESLIIHSGLSEAFEWSRAIGLGEESSAAAFLITGASGLGKTHLLHAIGNARRTKHGTESILVTTGRDLAETMVETFRAHDISRLRGDLERLDLLLIDDLGDLERVSRCQEELSRLLLHVNRVGVTIVCTSDRTIERLPHMERIWGTIGGTVTSLRPPTFSESYQILQSHLCNRGAYLPGGDVARAARRCPGDMARLIASGNRLRFEYEAG